MLAFVITGYATAAALIMAIGAQNAFVLAQGVKRQHHWPVVWVCIAGDALFISLGMLGAGVVVNSWPEVLHLFRLGGFLFLLWYGAQALKRFVWPSALKAGVAQASLKAALLMALAVTFLNPHVYLDTVVLLGSIGNQYTGSARYGFWVGAVMASASWFVLLNVLAMVLAPWLGKANVWRWVELLVGVIMWCLAGWLLWELLHNL